MDHIRTPAETPLDPVEVLRNRGIVAAADDRQAAEELREVMTDEQVLDQFGVDFSQLDD